MMHWYKIYKDGKEPAEDFFIGGSNIYIARRRVNKFFGIKPYSDEFILIETFGVKPYSCKNQAITWTTKEAHDAPIPNGCYVCNLLEAMKNGWTAAAFLEEFSRA